MKENVTQSGRQLWLWNNLLLGMTNTENTKSFEKPSGPGSAKHEPTSYTKLELKVIRGNKIRLKQADPNDQIHVFQNKMSSNKWIIICDCLTKETAKT